MPAMAPAGSISEREAFLHTSVILKVFQCSGRHVIAAVVVMSVIGLHWAAVNALEIMVWKQLSFEPAAVAGGMPG